MDVKTALARVEELRTDLSAMIPEKGHTEGGYREPGDSYYLEGGEWVVDEPAVPDNEKREISRTGLKAILEGDGEEGEWVSARYAAGRALGIEYDDLMGLLIDGRNTMLAMLVSTKGGVIGHKTEIERECDVYHPGSSSGGDARESVWDEQTEKLVPVYGNVPDAQRRVRAVLDAASLFKLSDRPEMARLLRLAYTENDIKEARVEAGRGLGYSGLRIWTHEHPVATTLAGLAGAGAIGYALFELLR